MYFSSPTSNITTPAMVSTAMSRSDSRDSTTSTSSFTSTAMHISFSSSPPTYRMNSATNLTRMHRDSISSGWIPSPYRSCMMHSSTSSQGRDASSSYISDDDLLALEDLAMPPVEHIPSIASVTRQQQQKPELTTEEHIVMLREIQEREQAQLQQQQLQRQRTQQQQKTVRFATEQTKPRRPSGPSQRRSTTVRR